MYTFNKNTKTALKEHSLNVAGAVSSLENGTFVKIICGAANTNSRQVERLSLVYSLTGVDVIDISPSTEIIQAAKSGIKQALEIYRQNPEMFPGFKEPVLMVSLDSGNDLHFRKAEVNYNKCINCLACIDSCPSKAIFAGNSSLDLDKNKCYGCGRCIQACQHNAINFINFNCSPDINLEGIKAIEVHTGNNSIEEVKNFLELSESLLQNTELLSFCVESKRFNAVEMQDYVDNLINLAGRKVIIQIDGVPMGATDKPCSSLQAISAAAILLENNTNAYIQVSGGVNHHTKSLIKQFGLKISGIAYGTFARKIILSYIDELNNDDFFEQLQQIVNITTNLVEI